MWNFKLWLQHKGGLLLTLHLPACPVQVAAMSSEGTASIVQMELDDIAQTQRKSILYYRMLAVRQMAGRFGTCTSQQQDVLHKWQILQSYASPLGQDVMRGITQSYASSQSFNTGRRAMLDHYPNCFACPADSESLRSCTVLDSGHLGFELRQRQIRISVLVESALHRAAIQPHTLRRQRFKASVSASASVFPSSSSS